MFIPIILTIRKDVSDSRGTQTNCTVGGRDPVRTCSDILNRIYIKVDCTIKVGRVNDRTLLSMYQLYRKIVDRLNTRQI